jgi:hypothetical protein
MYNNANNLILYVYFGDMYTERNSPQLFVCGYNSDWRAIRRPFSFLRKIRKWNIDETLKISSTWAVWASKLRWCGKPLHDRYECDTPCLIIERMKQHSFTFCNMFYFLQHNRRENYFHFLIEVSCYRYSTMQNAAIIRHIRTATREAKLCTYFSDNSVHCHLHYVSLVVGDSLKHELRSAGGKYRAPETENVSNMSRQKQQNPFTVKRTEERNV